jgi:hypothetical protein
VLKDAGSVGDDGSTEADGGLDARDASPADATTPDAGPPPPDSDGDGLPDALDPQPSVVNLALFRDDFSAEDPTWLFTSSAMAPRGGVLTVAATDAIVREGWLGPQPNWTNTVAYTRVRVLRRGRSTDDGAGRFSLIARVQQVAPDRYLACGVDVRTGTAFLAEHNGGNTAGSTFERSATCKTEHNSPDPYGGARVLQGSTCGFFGIYDFSSEIFAKLEAARLAEEQKGEWH